MSARSFHHHKARRIMRKCIVGFSLAALLLVVTGPARTEEGGDAKAVIDKAIKALGGEDKLAKAFKGSTWKTKGTISFNGNDTEMTTEATVQGLDHYKLKFVGSFGEGAVAVAGDKGAVNFGGMENEMDKDRLANEKRNMYLAAVGAFVVPLKEKGFKTEAIPEEKVGDKPAVGFKVTAPDGKDFKIYFDKETGLPVKSVAKVLNFGGQEVTQETVYSNYKEMGGIKKATKTSSKHDGEKFIESEITEFKILDKVDPKIFEKP
jgi:hypothetical protein